ncbi:hypothetical protein AWH48_20195 [Domibacillus aminovorans]|uniref:Uncharacterized protein n=1 Tax=Domibacillus aminovorans TaxID=29332 RepID=A0A177KPX9_9BACI|nr:DUF6241 domain-containing protein [Domibacillus aminovorans]OAH55187.1 hypothetical protein AWH48_20195 [Domibacillus aminovorans]
MKKIIGWSIVAGMVALMIGGGFLLSSQKEETQAVESVSTSIDFPLKEEKTIEGFNDPITKYLNQRTDETREVELAREREIAAKYKAETGEDVKVVSLEGENTYVDGVIRNVDHLINYGKTQEDAIHVMHLMTHQKIQAEQKWGAAPLTPTTTAKLVETLESHPEYNPELLRVAKRWAANDFSEIDAQHNYLDTLLKGVVEEGHATGLSTPEEEKEFVLKYFDDSVAQELGFQ